MPILNLSCAMKVAKFTKEEIADLTLCRYLQQSLPGGSMDMCRWLHSTPDPPTDPDRSQRHANCIITIPFPHHPEKTPRQCLLYWRRRSCQRCWRHWRHWHHWRCWHHWHQRLHLRWRCLRHHHKLLRRCPLCLHCRRCWRRQRRQRKRHLITNHIIANTT
jgi:hypothetical protein